MSDGGKEIYYEQDEFKTGKDFLDVILRLPNSSEEGRIIMSFKVLEITPVRA